MANSKPAPTDSAEAPKKGKGKLLLIIALLVVLLGGGGAAAYFLVLAPSAEEAAEVAADDGHEEEPAEKPKKKKKKAAEGPPPAPVYMPLDPMIVNLQPNGRFLQVAVTVELASPESQAQLTTYLPQVRSQLLMLVSSKTVDEVLTAEGKAALAEEMLAIIRKAPTADHDETEANQILFTSFILQ